MSPRRDAALAAIGKRGQRRRRELGLSIAAIAVRLGCSRGRVYNLECYGAGSLRIVEAWALALDMPPARLAFGVSEP